MKHKLSQAHKEMCKKIKNYKKNNIENKNELYLILEEPVLKLILQSDITPTSKILLVYLLSRVHFTFEHLYIFLPYKELEKQTGIKKPTAINSLKDLDEKGFIKLHSGTKRVKNQQIREFIFSGTEQYFNAMRNQPNIVEMTPFYAKFIKAEK